MNPARMREALDLARKGRALASPNPMVGAVLERDGEVVGRGYHTWAGVLHAEALALSEAGEKARGATLYVSLEPCAHQGRTPRCADALIVAGVGTFLHTKAKTPQARGIYAGVGTFATLAALVLGVALAG